METTNNNPQRKDSVTLWKNRNSNQNIFKIRATLLLLLFYILSVYYGESSSRNLVSIVNRVDSNRKRHSYGSGKSFTLVSSFCVPSSSLSYSVDINQRKQENTIKGNYVLGNIRQTGKIRMFETKPRLANYILNFPLKKGFAKDFKFGEQNKIIQRSSHRLESRIFVSTQEESFEENISESDDMEGSVTQENENDNNDGANRKVDEERVISLSDAALKHLGELKEKQGTNELCLRMGVRSGGCSGMSYVMDVCSGDDISEEDHIEEYADIGVRAVIDPKSLLYLFGLQLDYKDALIGGGFQFYNPNADETCGCGKSFGV